MTGKPGRTKSLKKSRLSIPARCPYADGGRSYAMIWTILYNHRQHGITKEALLKKVRRYSRKREVNLLYDIAVVTSLRRDKSGHRSALPQADIYWIERMTDGRLKMHLRKRS